MATINPSNLYTEEWRDIIGYDHYLVSSLGNVKRKESLFVRTDGRIRRFKERVLGGGYNKGYRHVTLQKTGDSRKHQIHRLVAAAFIPNPGNLPQVNHKNGVPSDNRVENLEWVTSQENALHALEVLGKEGGKKNGKPIICLNNGTEYPSAREAARALGIPKNNICNVAKGRHGHAFGYKFKYANECN